MSRERYFFYISIFFSINHAQFCKKYDYPFRRYVEKIDLS